MRHPRVAAAFVLALALAVRVEGGPGQPGAAEVSPGVLLFEQWLAVVAAHEPRVLDQALATAARWYDGDLWTVAMYVHVVHQAALDDGVVTARRARVMVPGGIAARDLVLSDGDRERLRTLAPLRATLAPWLKRAALFHTDVALLGAATRVPVSAAPAGVAQLRLELDDGRGVAVDRITAHWAMSRWLAARLPSPQEDAWVSGWYAATAAAQQARAQFGGGHLAEALQRLPDDARLWFLRGCEHEAFASPLLQEARRATQPPRGMRFEMEDADRERTSAARAFRRAAELDPAATEPRLRLARVLVTQGKPAEAAALLRALPVEALNPPLAYLARLFLGDAEDALDRPRDARAAYEAATALYPTAQSARLALARLVRLDGGAATAQEALATALDVPDTGGVTPDPWWDYLVLQARGWEDRLLALWRTLEAVTP